MTTQNRGAGGMGRGWVGGLAVFAALSAADFTQTYALIAAGRGDVYEANPVAAAWLDGYGWAGLAAFKALAVLVFSAVTVALAGRSRRATAGVLGFGCAALLAVTLYSRQLLAESSAAPVAVAAVTPGR